VRKKRRVIAVLLVTGASLLVIIGHSLRQRPEPHYQGLPLNYWVRVGVEGPRFDGTNGALNQARAPTALRHIGTNAIPFLLRWAKYEEPWTIRLLKRAQLSETYWRRSLARPESISRRNYLAAGVPDAFMWLGTAAVPAIPELTRLAEDAAHPEAAERALEVLTGLGPEAVPALGKLVSTGPVAVRVSAIRAVARLGTNATAILPSLIQHVRDPNREVATWSLWSLGNLGLQPDQTVPALAEALRDARPEIRLAALNQLSPFLCAKPDTIKTNLTRLLHDPEPRIRADAAQALHVINSEQW
jgi:hypothetical protein